MTNEELDLELFKVCYPKCKIHYAEWDDGHKYPEFIPSGKPLRTHAIDLRPVPQFTKDIGVCFAILIPEMNRRGFVISLIQSFYDGCVYYEALFLHVINQSEYKEVDTEPQIAISKSAYAALRGRNVK